MTKLDGNVLAGRLADVLGWDPTAADVRCTHCGAHGAIAIAVVYATAMGTVARCTHCDGVLAVFVEGDGGRSWFGMSGISALEMTP
jgi:phage FluMu protein Com